MVWIALFLIFILCPVLIFADLVVLAIIVAIAGLCIVIALMAKGQLKFLG